MKLTLNERNQTVEGLQKVFDKCYDDAAFKERLIASPVNELNKLGADVSLDAGKTLVIEDQTNPDVIYFNIPAKVEKSSVELTDEQLEAVAGGTADTVKYELNLGSSTTTNWSGTTSTTFTAGIKISF